MQTLSKDMAKILASNTRSRNTDTAEVQEDLNGLRVVAAQVLAQLAGVVDMEVNAVGVILMDKPVGEEVAKGTRSQNRANRFRKAAKLAGLEEKLHYTVSRSEPPNDVVAKRLEMDEATLKDLPPPHNDAPWGWILVNFTEDGLKELSHWGETQDKVADFVTEHLEAYQTRLTESAPVAPTAEDQAEPTEDNTEDTTSEDQTEEPTAEPARRGGRR
jgi:hypothetical protein